MLIAALAFACALHSKAEPPTVVLMQDNFRVAESCIIEIPPDRVIRDADGNGVIHIIADDVRVEFKQGSTLRGQIKTTPNTYTGVGLSIVNARNVQVVNARVEGFKVGILAQHADGLVIRAGTFRDNYRQRLRSTPAAEDASDWLFPHDNDERQWVTQHGAAICIERSANVTISGVSVRETQNGIMLDRVSNARVFDNDASFLSGWGLAMWRSSGNLISRNAFDFCVRGHSEGVYNRGQDSAGILCFEQCNDNVFIENSATHGGDGFFGFAGNEALGQKPPAGEIDYADAGCNGNIFIGNDFSYAAAHGLELTFSERNVIFRNRFVENAISGIWGGYSSNWWIVENEFERNGGMAYGLERGGINIEHGFDHRILSNRFVNNRAGIHLWWDDDVQTLALPGVSADNRAISGIVIGDNRFIMNEAEWPMVGTHLRDLGEGHFRDNAYAGNAVEADAKDSKEWDAPESIRPPLGTIPDFDPPVVEPIGDTRPVGARAELRGRARIIMDEWGPWDGERPLLRRKSPDGGALHTFEVYGVEQDQLQLKCRGADVVIAGGREDSRWSPLMAIVRPSQGGPDVTHFALRASTSDNAWITKEEGTLVRAEWQVRAFNWTNDADPRTNLDAWRALAEGADPARLSMLKLPFGHGGPHELNLSPWRPPERGDRIGKDRFGVIARTNLVIPKGLWKFRTLSDDGVRVRVGDSVVIENWTWHAPATNEGELRVEQEASFPVEVEYFEIDGYAVLELAVELKE